MTRRGFTLLEVMVAAALLSVVTAGAMAAFIAQSRATNTQQQTSTANDDTRAAIRFMTNDVRSAAAGITPGAGGIANCDQGTIPFDGNGTTPIACVPPVFRTNTPLILPGQALGSATTFNACGGSGPGHTGYQLSFAGGLTVPPAGRLFCPDDLVVLGVDDANPLFMVQSPPGTQSHNNATPILFGGTSPIYRNLPTCGASPTGAGYGFDDAAPGGLASGPCQVGSPPFLQQIPGAACPLSAFSQYYCESMMLFGGPSGAVLMNTGYTPGLGSGTPWPGGGSPFCVAGLPTQCDVVSYGLVPSTPSVDLFANNLSFGTVAMPAHLYRYSIEPLDAAGNASNCSAADPCVSANLIRSQIVPSTQLGGAVPGTNFLNFLTVSSSVLVEGVVDMQVEFGIQVKPGQALSYVNSGGLQSTPWTNPSAIGTQPASSTALAADNCLAGATADNGVWTGVCFPSGGINGLNALANLRTVRLNLTIRSGTTISSRSVNSNRSTTSIGTIPQLQPAIQDILPGVGAGNAEAQQWGWLPGASWAPNAAGIGNGTSLFAMDGAAYRQVSTEIYIRNLGWTNNL